MYKSKFALLTVFTAHGTYTQLIKSMKNFSHCEYDVLVISFCFSDG